MQPLCILCDSLIESQRTQRMHHERKARLFNSSQIYVTIDRVLWRVVKGRDLTKHATLPII